MLLLSIQTSASNYLSDAFLAFEYFEGDVIGTDSVINAYEYAIFVPDTINIQTYMQLNKTNNTERKLRHSTIYYAIFQYANSATFWTCGFAYANALFYRNINIFSSVSDILWLDFFTGMPLHVIDFRIFDPEANEMLLQIELWKCPRSRDP